MMHHLLTHYTDLCSSIYVQFVNPLALIIGLKNRQYIFLARCNASFECRHFSAMLIMISRRVKPKKQLVMPHKTLSKLWIPS